MVRKQRSFIEAAVAAVQEAKELVLPVLLVDEPDDPWAADRIRELHQHREDLDPVLASAVDVLIDFEVPFLEQEAKMVGDGITLSTDMATFEDAMVEFERRFWEERFEEHRADPDRWNLPEPVIYDVCEKHKLTTADVLRAVHGHDLTDFEELAPVLGTQTSCSTCHAGITRVLLHAVKRRKQNGEPLD